MKQFTAHKPEEFTFSHAKFRCELYINQLKVTFTPTRDRSPAPASKTKTNVHFVYSIKFGGKQKAASAAS